MAEGSAMNDTDTVVMAVENTTGAGGVARDEEWTH